jgi:DNA-binding FrmR family transcriptional regulator
VQCSAFLASIPPWGILGDMKTDTKYKVVRRLKLIEGQVRGLQRMVDEEKYCVDIITQTSAIKEALSGVEGLMLENHLSTHVIEQMRSGKNKQAISEILKVYRLAQKKK